MVRKQKLSLIEKPTTHTSDYQIWPVQPLVEAKSSSKSREPRPVKPPPPHVFNDIQSHAPYKSSAHVPFDLYLRPKPIVGTDPRECFQAKKRPKGRLKDESSRPMTTLSPTLAMNQVKDEESFNKIINYTFTTMQKLDMEEAALKNLKTIKTPERVVAEGNDLCYKPVIYQPLSPNWIVAARHWDSLQSRNLGDPFKTFWTRRGPEIECSCCYNPILFMLPEEMKEEINRLICENKLSLPYDVAKLGYGGYRPIVAKGASLEKK